MNEYERIILIILASFLAIFLILGIIVLYKLIQIFTSIKRITAKAESVADKVENVSGFFAKTAAPAALGKLLLNLLHSFNHKKSKSKRGNDDE